MLDYKIKELKKQIEPRENEIKVMKEQIQEVRRPHPALSLPRPAIPGWPGGMEESSPHSPSLLHSSEDALETAAGRSAVQSEMLGDLAGCRSWGGLWPCRASRSELWALEGKTMLLGLRPPGGSVCSATSRGHQ